MVMTCGAVDLWSIDDRTVLLLMWCPVGLWCRGYTF